MIYSPSLLPYMVFYCEDVDFPTIICWQELPQLLLECDPIIL